MTKGKAAFRFGSTTNPGSRGTSYRDAFGNSVHQFNILPEHQRLKIEAESVVLVHEAGGFHDPGTLADFESRKAQLGEEFFDFLAPSTYVPRLDDLRPIVDAAEQASGGTVDGFAKAASSIIHGLFQYVKGATHVHSSIKDSLSINAGVCQDFAHVLLGVVRMRGLPARYVSGYLVPGSAAHRIHGRRKLSVGRRRMRGPKF